MLAIKPDEVGWQQFGWRTVSKASEIDPTKGEKWRLLPPYGRAAEEHTRACQQIWAEGSWCCAVDEMYYEKELGLEKIIIRFLAEGRAKKITVVSGMQRPAFVTKFAFSEATHHLIGRLQRTDDRKRIRDELGREVVFELDRLDPFEFIHYNSITDAIRRVREDTVLEAFGVHPARVSADGLQHRV